MNPFLILLLGLGATAAADVEWDWRKKDQLDQLRKRLGLWPSSPTWPGSIAQRLRWIDQTYGLQAAIWAQRVAVLYGEPTFAHHVYDETRLAPLLPWLAWRLSKGEAPELVRVLEADSFFPLEPVEGMPGSKPVAYNKEEAWSDIDRLVDWLHKGKPNLFNYTWEEAKKQEESFFAKSLKPYTEHRDWNVPVGQFVWRPEVRDSEDEKDWYVQRLKGLEGRGALEILGVRGNNLYGQFLYVLHRPSGEPVAAIVTLGRNDRPMQIVAAELEQYWEIDPEVDIVKQLLEFMQFQWPIEQWPGEIGAYLAISTAKNDDEAIELLHRNPEIFSIERGGGMGEYVDSMHHDYFGPKFIEEWARLINEYPEQFDELYADTAASQIPSRALGKWLHTEDWDYKLAGQPMMNYREVIPEILHQYTVDYGRPSDPEADLTEMHHGDYDRAIPWEIKIWDIYRHPDGPELEMKIQVLVVYDPQDSYAWRVVSQREAEFRPVPGDASTYLTTPDFHGFKFYEFVDDDYRMIDEDTVRSALHYKSNFEEVETTHSLDGALKAAWKQLMTALDDTLDEEEVAPYFESSDLIDPDDSLEVEDVLEGAELLHG